MKYLILMLALLPYRLPAQSTMVGLGDFIIGVTSPDSLGQLPFIEHELVVVKGTIAFSCEHIRVFTADSLEVEGVQITNLSLVFYEDQLFRITCDYSDALQQVFVRQHGVGAAKPISTLALCDDGNGKRMQIDTRQWRNGDVIAMVIRASGYNALCEPEQLNRLTIASQSVMSYSSECNLEELDPYFEQGWRTP